MPKPTASLSIHFLDPNLSDDRLQSLTENLLLQVREIDGVDQARLKPAGSLPQGAKSLGGFSLGFLTAEINSDSVGNLLMFLGECLTGKRIIELEVEANSKKIKVKAHGKEELQAVISMVESFIASSESSA